MSRVIDEVSIGVKGYLMFKKVIIEDANSISSPITYGFPAITGFLGSFHAMSRKMTEDAQLTGVSLGGVLIACYDCQPQIYRPNTYSNYTFNQTRNPIKRDGKTASIIEEGKCRLVVSFVVEILADDGLMPEQQNRLIKQTTQWIQQQRMAGGSVQGLARFDAVRYFNQSDVSMLIPQLLPAFVLMDASDDFVQIIETVRQDNPEANALDALIDVCALHQIPETQKNGDTKWSTMSRKSGHGWVVPMPIGYQGISDTYEAGVMQNVRNPEYASQYVEAIYGLGKWVYPQRLNDMDGKNAIVNAFWRYHYDADQSLYLVTQNHSLS